MKRGVAEKAPVKRKLSRREQRRLERERRKEERRQQRRLARERRRRRLAQGVAFLGFAGLACLVGLAVTLILGRPYPWTVIRDSTEALDTRRRLDEARARWDSLAVRHYRIDVTYWRGEVVCGPAQIEVRNGEVVASPDQGEGHWFPPEACDSLLEKFTIEGAFGWLRAELNDFSPAQTYLHANFDPDFGYLTSVESGSYRSDDPGCCWRASWANMRPLGDE